MKKRLPIILMVDCSGSMFGDKIDVVNSSILNLINSFKQLNNHNIYLSVISFATEARKHLDFTPLADVKWVNLTAGGCTNFAAALKMLTDSLSELESGNILYPEIIVISDGSPTDFNKWEEEVARLTKLRISKGINFNAIFIGDDDGLSFLKKFLKKVNKLKINEVFQASNVMYIKDFFNNLELQEM